jgi:hypothetical protein
VSREVRLSVKFFVLMILSFVLIYANSSVLTQAGAELPDPQNIFVEGVEWLLIQPEILPTVQPTHVLQTVCEGTVVQAEADEDGEWIVAYHDGDPDAPYLCHSKTGETRDTLPEGLDEWRVFPSPNHDYLVMAARDWALYGDFSVFAYHLETNEIIHLGDLGLGANDLISLCSWVNETGGVLCSGISSFSHIGESYFAFDVTVADSLVYAFTGWRETILRLENPPRYVSLIGENYASSRGTGRGLNHTPCTLTVLDGEQHFDLEVGYDCIPIILNDSDYAPYYQQGNLIYFLTTESAESTISTLQSYDIQNLNQNQQLFVGEIETIVSVSPDGRYVVLLLDDNGSLDFPWRGLIQPCCREVRGYQVVILDNESGELVYRSEPIGVIMADQVVWINERSVVIGARHESDTVRVTEDGFTIGSFIPPSLRRITFNDDMSVNIAIDTGYNGYLPDDLLGVNTSPNNRYWLRGDQTVLDLTNFQPVPILREGVTDNYAVRTTWLENGDLEVWVTTESQSAWYHVTLP